MIDVSTRISWRRAARCETSTECSDREEFGPYPPPVVRQVQQKLAIIAAMPANWDQQGAPRVSRIALQSALDFAKVVPWHLLRRPHIAPTPDGNVQMEWHHGDVSLEVEFGADGKTYYLKWDPANGIEDAGGIEEYQVGGQQLLRWFAGKTRNVDC